MPVNEVNRIMAPMDLERCGSCLTASYGGLRDRLKSGCIRQTSRQPPVNPYQPLFGSPCFCAAKVSMVTPFRICTTSVCTCFQMPCT